jgi:hypothetical protein
MAFLSHRLLLTQPLKTNIFVGYINYCAIGNTDHKIILNMFSIIPNISESEGIKEKGHIRQGAHFVKNIVSIAKGH